MQPIKEPLTALKKRLVHTIETKNHAESIKNQTIPTATAHSSAPAPETVKLIAELKSEHAEMKKEIKTLHSSNSECERRCVAVEEQLESVTIDKEMMEEKLEAAQLELELLTEECDELKSDVQVYKNQTEGGTSVNVNIQLEKQNERLKEALVR